MHSVVHLIQSVDLSVYYWLSSFHGSWVDNVTIHQEANTFFKSTLLIGTYWYFWFREGHEQQQRRATIITIFSGTLVGLIATRLIAGFAPFRVRPLYDLNLHHQSLSVPSPTDFMNWSSFPSDHAAYLGALGFGLILLSRRLAIPVTLFLAGWVCLPRLYLGIHYLSDVVVGAAIGIAAVLAAQHIKFVNLRVARPLVAFADARPEIFFMAAYLTMYEMGSLFWDIRGPVHALLHITGSVIHHKVLDAAAISVIVACGVIAGYFRSVAHGEDSSHDSARMSLP